MLFRITAYTLLFYTATLLMPELTFNFVDVVMGKEQLSDLQMYTLGTIFLVVEGALNTKYGYKLKRYFYIFITVGKALIVVGLFSSVAYARSERFEGAQAHLDNLCEIEIIRSLCTSGVSLLDGLPL